MNTTDPAVRTGAWAGSLDDRTLLASLLTAASSGTPPLVAPVRPWPAPASLRPVPARCSPTRTWPTARCSALHPLATAATLLLAGGIVAASYGAAPARATGFGAGSAAPAGAVNAAPVRSWATGALATLKLAPAADRALLARLLAAPTTSSAGRANAVAPAASRANQSLLAELLASEPPAAVAPAAAPPAAVSFATVARLPASAFAYTPAAVQLPMITLADNLPPPPPPPVQVIAAQQPPPPAGYVEPPGYQNGVPFGGQIGAVPRAGTTTTRTTTTRTTTTRTTTTRTTVYVVREGDTLSAIAVRFYGSAAYAPAIWEANYRLIGANPNLIIAGTRLTLPGLTTKVVTVAVTPLPARGPISQHANYTIQPRDFLRWMSERAYGNERLWPEIYDANRNVLGPNPDLIYPGVSVYIP